MANGDIKDIVRAVESATTFPVLTQPVSPRTGTAATGLPAGTTSFGPLVRNALHEVLSWRPSVTDVKGLKEALLYSFSPQETSGRTVYNHVPRSYIMQVQSDGGAVTGAQASIHARAKAAVDQSLPLLEGLYPLNSDSDREDLAAVKATIRTALTGMVEELARPGGPRLQRVDTIFDLLLGTLPQDPAGQFDINAVGGQLGLLRDRLGLAPERINSSEEEKDLTNFLILVDYVHTLRLSWNSLRGFFDRIGNDVFLGPQLVQIARALRVLAESVHESYDALDSVFIGPAEREIILLRFDNGEPPLTLGDLLGWVESFASAEGPRLIQDAGKDGVIALRSTARRLSDLLHETLDILKSPSNNPPRGAHTERVIAPVTSVSLYADQLVTLVNPFSRLPLPRITGVRPNVVEAVDGTQIRIDGVNFTPGSEVVLTLEDEEIEAVAVHFVSPTTLFALFDLESDEAIPEDWTVVVRTADGIESELADALTIVEAPVEPGEPPVIFDIELPAAGIEVGDVGVPVEITGKAFQANATVTFTGPAGTPGQVALDSPVTLDGHSRLSFKVTVAANAKPGVWKVTVTNPDGKTDVASFEVEEAEEEPLEELTVVSITPNVGPRNPDKTDLLRVMIKGTGFAPNASTDFGPQIKTITHVVDSETAEVDLWIRPTAALGLRDIRVVNRRHEWVRVTNGFRVEPLQGD